MLGISPININVLVIIIKYSHSNVNFHLRLDLISSAWLLRRVRMRDQPPAEN